MTVKQAAVCPHLLVAVALNGREQGHLGHPPRELQKRLGNGLARCPLYHTSTGS